MTDDLLLINGLVRTMDPGLPQTDAVLIRGGRIAALGQAAREARAQVIDLGGRLVLPGFQDAHIHLLNGGTRLVEAAQLYDADTIAALQATLAAHAATWPGPVLRGVGWHFGLFGDHNLTRQVIDAVVPDRPCVIFDANLHNACLNSAAIALIGLGDETPDPPNGHIVRDATGRATGMLHEAAVGWASAALPRTDAATLEAGLRAGQSLANRHGITGIIDPCIRSHHVTTYGAAAAAGRLTLRVACASLIRDSDTPETALARLTARRAAHSGPDFYLNAAKFFMDGVLENRTAALLAPYADGPGGNAPLMFPPDRIAALFTALDAARFQIHVHCIGCAATRATLDGVAAARAANGAWPALHQIAHVQVVDPADIPRFAALGVMANMQPLWAAHDPVTPEPTWAMIGPARLPFTYPFRSLVDAGAPFCVSSDWAVSTLNPFEIIGTAVTREPPRARGRAEPFFPHQRLSVAQAVQGYTTHAAAACWRADFTGQIRPGFSGDLIVLDRDIFTCDPYDIAETRVLLTLFKGRPVHRAEDFP